MDSVCFNTVQCVSKKHLHADTRENGVYLFYILIDQILSSFLRKLNHYNIFQLRLSVYIHTITQLELCFTDW